MLLSSRSLAAILPLSNATRFLIRCRLCSRATVLVRSVAEVHGSTPRRPSFVASLCGSRSRPRLNSRVISTSLCIHLRLELDALRLWRYGCFSCLHIARSITRFILFFARLKSSYMSSSRLRKNICPLCAKTTVCCDWHIDLDSIFLQNPWVSFV